MNRNSWIIFGAACVIFLGALVVFSQKDKIDVSAVDTSKIQPASEQNGNIAEHTRGKAGSKVVLTEYGDFQCPYCEQAYPNVKKINEKYDDRITFVFRNFPLTQMHPNAKAAASAAEAAGLQGKYWEMNDKLYSVRTWVDAPTDKRTNIFIDYAKAIGVKDIDKFKADMGDTFIAKKIRFDIAIADKDGVSGTPAFFLNGKQVEDKVSGSVINGDGSEMEKALDELLK